VTLKLSEKDQEGPAFYTLQRHETVDNSAEMCAQKEELQRRLEEVTNEL